MKDVEDWFILMDKRSYLFRIIALWALILSLLMFIQNLDSTPIGLSYYPAVPREGEPVQVSVRLNNPTQNPKHYSLKVYLDGAEAMEWKAEVEAGQVKDVRIIQLDSIGVGECLRVYVEAFDADSGQAYAASAMVPPFPPETFSSFISFASFSSTLMGYMTTMSYYTTTVTYSEGLNAGLAISLTLIGLLIFTELTDPAYGKTGERISRLRRNFTKEAAILLIIFLAMVATKITFIIIGA